MWFALQCTQLNSCKNLFQLATVKKQKIEEASHDYKTDAKVGVQD